MIAKFTGRIVFLPRGRDPLEDLNILADCIAESGADLFNDQNECVIWLTAGQRVGVTPETLREIIAKHVVTKHAHETAEGWEVEYKPYEVDDKTLHALIMAKTRDEGGLMQRLPKTPRVLSRFQQQEIGDQLGRGEPAARIAYSYGATVDDVKRLAR